MKKLFLLSAFFIFTCNSDNNEDENTQEQDQSIKVVNNGTGAVLEINDSEDSDLLKIVQAVPAVSGEYSSKTPIMLFFNDKVLIESISDSFIIKQNDELIGGTISISEAANGYAIFVFIPNEEFDGDATITITVSTDILDDGGNPLVNEFLLEFTTVIDSSGNFDENNNFENNTSGVSFIGDGDILNGPSGCVSAQNGEDFAVITTGSQLVSTGTAIDEASSMMILGPITDRDVSSLSFYYNFVSSEFQEFVGSEFDDTAIFTIYGPDGSYSSFITSVNYVEEINNTECDGFAGLPDDGDEYAGQTDWTSQTYNFLDVGTPSYIVFTITDVGDEFYSSAIAIDNISY